jgi:hypothetical protein
MLDNDNSSVLEDDKFVMLEFLAKSTTYVAFIIEYDGPL